MGQALVQQATGDVLGAPPYTDFIAAFTADPRVVGVWRMNDEYVTISSGLVTQVANLKAAGPALIAAGGNKAAMIYDPILGRNVMSMVPAVGAQYSCAFNLNAHASGFTMASFFRPTAAAHYSGFSYLLSTDGTWPLIQRGNQGASPAFNPLIETALWDPADGTASTISLATVIVNDPYGWMTEQVTFDAAKNVKTDINGGTQSTTTATTITPGTTTTFYVGTPVNARMPTCNVDAVALFGCDINAPGNADLRRIWDEFKAEAFR